MESRDIRVETEIKCIPVVVVVVVVVVCIFRYYIYIYKSQLKNKEEGRSGTTWTGVSQKDLQRGERNK